MIAVVPADSAYVVERLGRYRATLPPGLHFLVPFVDHIAHKFSLAPRDDEFSDVAITLDNISVSMKATVTWQITNAERAAYAVADLMNFVTSVVRNSERQWISERAWSDVRETTRDLQQAVLRSTEEPARTAGVKIVAFNVRQIDRA